MLGKTQIRVHVHVTSLHLFNTRFDHVALRMTFETPRFRRLDHPTANDILRCAEKLGDKRDFIVEQSEASSPAQRLRRSVNLPRQCYDANIDPPC